MLVLRRRSLPIFIIIIVVQKTYDNMMILLFEMGVTRNCTAFKHQCSSEVSHLHLKNGTLVRSTACARAGLTCLHVPFLVRELKLSVVTH